MIRKFPNSSRDAVLSLQCFLYSALDAAEQHGKVEPDLSYVLEIKPATKIMHLMFSFINTALIPLSQISLTTRREMVKLTNIMLASLEQKINTILQKTVEGEFVIILTCPLGEADLCSCHYLHRNVTR